MKWHDKAMAFVVAWLLLITMSDARAQSPTEMTPLQASWPDTFTITAGDVRTRIEASKMWTMSGIEFQETVMAVQDSAYGTVLTIRNVGHLGTAHFLEVPGRPGMIEKENVHHLRFFVDDQPVTDLRPEMNVRGQSFRMERKSSIRSLKLESSVSIRDNVLFETSRWHATEPIDLQKGHPLMYAFTPKATVYAFGDDVGIRKRGAFQIEGNAHMTTKKGFRWMGCFDPVSGKGSVCYVAEQPVNDGADAWFMLIDVPGVYRKLALYNFVDRIVPQGFTGTYRTAVGFFAATEADWEQQALKRVVELKSAVDRGTASENHE